jgi:hypothetical protein
MATTTIIKAGLHQTILMDAVPVKAYPGSPLGNFSAAINPKMPIAPDTINTHLKEPLISARMPPIGGDIV